MKNFGGKITKKALDFGACCAGIANIEDLKQLPSFKMMPMRPHIDRGGAVSNETGLPEGVVAWPEGMKSVLVIAYEHPQEDPILDCWLDEKNPPGNMMLAKIIRSVKEWLDQSHPDVQSIPMGYYVEKGGIWLKDAAAAAGLGIIGKNNLLVTPRYGPRVRLRAMYLSADIPSTGPINWDPCKNCPAPCRTACPQKAFSEVVYAPQDYAGLQHLPGRSGCYDLRKCDIQMAADEANMQVGEFNLPGYGEFHSILPYCRACEFGCIIGSTQSIPSGDAATPNA